MDYPPFGWLNLIQFWCYIMLKPWRGRVGDRHLELKFLHVFKYVCVFIHTYIYIYTYVLTYTAHKAYWGSNSSVDDLGKSQTASHVWSSWVPEMIQWFLDQWKCWLTSSFDPSSPEIKCQSIEAFMFGSPLVRFQYLRISASTIHPIFPQWAPNFYDYWNTHGVNSMCWPQIT